MTLPFISRTDLSDYLGRDVTTDPGALACVDAACDIVRDVTEQTFNHGTTTDVLDGTGTDALLLPELPVHNAGTVEVLNLNGDASTWGTVGSADYALDDDGTLFATDRAGTALLGASWPRGRQNVRVTYEHGYTLGTAGDLPRSVRMVALTVASRLLVQGPAIFENLGDLNVRYAAESTALMPTERLVLTKHRRRK
jgi:hypothetical protein